ncbi:hypothetical protein BCR36DRAFT_96532 [Piromyces finnis]|uniref:G-protein coupled receptors family 3 profile domain-containing protein n=1 Tax=Piromyces finnis TaxID=1754191 RepID=A0A1Y1V5P0_9FUNG|nr:hypothetical protein BCR36DRAFT_96532 [Piromyces finnis]|eukprot:ORX47341.1 hypothetical protein BCR36DRAFT_96532 [Piromyces finnis]
MISSQELPNYLKCKLYDDYGNDFIFFKIEVDDIYNTKLIGQYLSYCWNNECAIPPLKVVGNPGNYKLSLKISSFGPFDKFENNVLKIDLEIQNCNEEIYKYQNIDDSALKSCYLPECNPPCMNGGKCINNNICDCSNTFTVGKYCNEYNILERIKKVDLILKIIAIILFILTIVLMSGIIMFKDNLIIKSASINFQIIILIGILFNIAYLWTLTKNKSSIALCTRIYIYKNLGFSLVFGSILAKTYRIYKIISYKKSFSVVKEETMFAMVFIMMLFHTLILGICYITRNIRSVVLYNNYREYNDCYFSDLKNLSTIFNIIILFIGYALSYATRGADKNFKERLSMPVYTYILFTILSEIINIGNEEISIIVQDFFNAFGIIINTLVIMYYLYIHKFISIFVHNQIIMEQQNPSKWKNTNNVFFFERQTLNREIYLSSNYVMK